MIFDFVVIDDIVESKDVILTCYYLYDKIYQVMLANGMYIAGGGSNACGNYSRLHRMQES